MIISLFMDEAPLRRTRSPDDADAGDRQAGSEPGEPRRQDGKNQKRHTRSMKKKLNW
jgi:hypothetical protein